MNKKEFKTAFQTLRKGDREFEEYMQRSNFPCGHDDMLYDNHHNRREEFLSQHHKALRYAVVNRYEVSPLEERQRMVNDYKECGWTSQDIQKILKNYLTHS